MCVCVFQMNSDLLDLAHELPGWEYKWTCAICLINAKAGILLEFQLRDIDNHLFVYFDTDQTPGFSVGGASISFI